MRLRREQTFGSPLSDNRVNLLAGRMIGEPECVAKLPRNCGGRCPRGERVPDRRGGPVIGEKARAGRVEQKPAARKTNRANMRPGGKRRLVRSSCQTANAAASARKLTAAS